jgi:hypothetical protein
MIIVTAPAEELKASSKISRVVNLETIRLSGLRVDAEATDAFFDESDATQGNVQIKHAANMKELVSGKHLVANVSAEIIVRKASSHITYNLEYLVTYSLPKDPIPSNISEPAFQAFAKFNGLLNCWPYIRSLASSLAQEVGLVITLPLLKVVPAEEPKKSVAKELPQT